MTDLARLRGVIQDDAYAATFQTMKQYRTALLQHVDNLRAAATALNQMVIQMTTPADTHDDLPAVLNQDDPIVDISIDIETLSTRQDAAIVSIGAVKFDRASATLGQAFYVEIDLDSAIQNGHVDGSTLAWWMSQGEEARAAMGDRGIPKPCLPAALLELTKFVGIGARPWGNGTTFDISILENAYRACGLRAPWDFWNIRDMRTLVDAASALGFDKNTVQRLGTAHHALDDAQYQAEVIASAWQHLTTGINHKPNASSVQTAAGL